MARIVNKDFTLTLQNGERKPFKAGAALPVEHEDHWFAIAHSIDTDPVIAQIEKEDAEDGADKAKK